MLIYEVNLYVRVEIYGEYFGWLKAHVDAMLRLRHFEKAEIWVFDPEPKENYAEERGLCVQYHCRHEDNLNVYLKEEAPRMRKEGTDRFPGGFRATRRVLKTPATQE